MKKKISLAAAAVAAVVLLWLLFRGTDWQELGAALRKASILWILLSLVPVFGGFLTRILRWKYIVRAVQPDATFRAMFSATQIGFLLNFTVGMRSGEVVRPLVLTRLTGIPFSKSMALSALDRVTDLVGLIAVLLVTAFALRYTGELVLPANTLGNSEPFVVGINMVRTVAYSTIGVTFAMVTLLVLLYVNQVWILKVTGKVLGVVSEKLAGWACGVLEQFAQGLHVFRSPTDMAKSLTFSLITWATFLLAGACIFNAFGLEYPWYSLFVMQSVLSAAVSLPGTPGMVGLFHLPVTVSLVALTATSPSEAKAVAIVLHLVNLFSVAVAGVYCLVRENMSLVALSREGEAAEEQLAHCEEGER